MRGSFRAKLLATHAALALVVGAVTLVVVERLVTRRMERQLDQRLEVQARAVAQWMERAGHAQQLARRLAGVVDARVTILDRHGIARGESTAPAGAPAVPDPDRAAPEIAAARRGGVGRATRYATPAGRYVRYVAVAAPNEVVVRLGVPIAEIEATKGELRTLLLAAAGASLVLALALAAAIAGPLTRRLRDATAVARRIGAGDYAVPPPGDARDEIGVLAASLATAASALGATAQRRREFLADVAHEIRTPVTSIRGYADLLAKGTVDAETSREFVHTIRRNAHRIGQLIEDLLELEALEAGQGPRLAAEPVALAPVVDAVRDTLRARADEQGARVRVALDDAPAARGDAEAIERILLNLVDNALRHGGRGVTVDVAARRDGARVALEVRDDGPGVPPAHRAHVFERFHRGDAHLDRERRGTGLGLAIARELAHAMGGTLELRGGSTFVLTLPASAPGAPPLR